MTNAATDLFAWAVTYAVHATVIIALAALAATLVRRDAWREMIWRTALLAPLVSATMQLALGGPPLTALLDIGPIESIATRAVEATMATTPAPIEPPPIATNEPAVAALDLPAAATGGLPAPTSAPPIERGAATTPGAAWSLRAIALTALAAAAALHGLVVTGAWIRLRRRMEGRVELTEGRARRLLDRVCAEARVKGPIRLTRSERIDVPTALGVRRREICLPAARLEELDDAALEIVLAHETAHLVRRDPTWGMIMNAVLGLSCLQPLNVLVVRRLRELAEFRCDAWAAARAGDGVPVARCLTTVASWLVDRRPVDLPGAAMADGRSCLGRRIHRLLDDDARADTRAPRAGAIVLPVAVAALGLVLAPGARAVRIDDGAWRAASLPVTEARPVIDLDQTIPELAILERELDLLRPALEGRAATDPLRDAQGRLERATDDLRRRAARLLEQPGSSASPSSGPEPQRSTP